MRILDKIFGQKAERDYKKNLAQVCNPIMDKIDKLSEKEVRDFFEIILDAAERCLRGILFMAPSESEFTSQVRDKGFLQKQMKETSAFYKTVTREDIDFWLRKVSLALVAYSYYSFSGGEESPMVQASYESYWERMFDSYNEVFGENITINDIDHYAAGLKEDTEEGYSKYGDMEKVATLAAKDRATIALELLEKIWNETVRNERVRDLETYKLDYGVENSDPLVKKILFLGARIWQGHQQIVQPFLATLLYK